MISDNITAKAAAINDEAVAFSDGKIDDTPIAKEVDAKATQAILEGQGILPDKPTQAWRDYMSLFSTSPEELDRLIPKDGTTDEVRQKARAYLVANGICSMGTTKFLANNVGTKLNLP